jgi:hypothetical protein
MCRQKTFLLTDFESYNSIPVLRDFSKIEKVSHHILNRKIRKNKIIAYLDLIRLSSLFLFQDSKNILKSEAVVFAYIRPEVSIPILFLLKTTIFFSRKRIKVKLFFPELLDTYPLRKMIISLILRFVDIVIVPSTDRGICTQAFYRVLTPYEIFPNCYNRYKSNNRIINSSRRSIASDDIRAVYTGVLYKLRPIENDLLELLESFPDAKISLYGKGSSSYIQYLCSLSLNITYKGEFDSDREDEILKKYNVGILSYPNDSLNNYFCAPNKVFSYAYSGLFQFSTGPSRLIQKLRLIGAGGDIVDLRGESRKSSKGDNIEVKISEFSYL